MTKKISLGFGILALIFIALLVVPQFISLDSWKPEIEKKLSESLGRKIRIDGSINLSILPYPGVTLTDVRLANADWGQPAEMVKADEITVNVALIPLLTKTLEF